MSRTTSEAIEEYIELMWKYTCPHITLYDQLPEQPCQFEFDQAIIHFLLALFSGSIGWGAGRSYPGKEKAYERKHRLLHS